VGRSYHELYEALNEPERVAATHEEHPRRRLLAVTHGQEHSQREAVPDGGRAREGGDQVIATVVAEGAAGRQGASRPLSKLSKMRHG
jgi:hypothetical protein